MEPQSVTSSVGPTAQEKADRLWNALRAMVARAIEKNNIRRGAKLDDLEANSAAVGHVVARALMETAAIEFGCATDEEVAEARARAVEQADPDLVSRLGGKEPRLVARVHAQDRVRAGPITARVFSPLGSLLDLPDDSYTPRVKRGLLERLAGDDCRDSARSLESCGNSISHQERPGPGEHAGRILEKEGSEVRRELFGPDAVVGARREAPPNAADLFIVEGDGSRLARQRRPIRRAPDLRLPDERGRPEEARRRAEYRGDRGRGSPVGGR